MNKVCGNGFKPVNDDIKYECATVKPHLESVKALVGVLGEIAFAVLKVVPSRQLANIVHVSELEFATAMLNVRDALK